MRIDQEGCRWLFHFVPHKRSIFGLPAPDIRLPQTNNQMNPKFSNNTQMSKPFLHVEELFKIVPIIHEK